MDMKQIYNQAKLWAEDKAAQALPGGGVLTAGVVISFILKMEDGGGLHSFANSRICWDHEEATVISRSKGSCSVEFSTVPKKLQL